MKHYKLLGRRRLCLLFLLYSLLTKDSPIYSPCIWYHMKIAFNEEISQFGCPLIGVLFGFVGFLQWQTRNPHRHLSRRSNSLRAPHHSSVDPSGCLSSFARLMVSILIGWVNFPMLSKGLLFASWPLEHRGVVIAVRVILIRLFSVSVVLSKLPSLCSCLIGNC